MSFFAVLGVSSVSSGGHIDDVFGRQRAAAAPHTQESLRALCDHCSDQERAADGLERRIKASCLVLASVQADSGARRARVTGVTPASLFVLCEDGIEARIPARDLPGGPYAVDPWESMLTAPEREVAERLEPHELKRLLAHFAMKQAPMLNPRVLHRPVEATAESGHSWWG